MNAVGIDDSNIINKAGNAAFAMHAHNCYIYIRGEYYNEYSNLQKAIDEDGADAIIGYGSLDLISFLQKNIKIPF